MRSLRRPAVVPPTLRDGGPGPRETQRHRAQRGADAERELEFPDHWNKPDVRGALFAMQGWVCAYCQCAIDPYDGGDVDHFRPKNGGERAEHRGYWWLAYRFDNYLLACRRCNEHVKREQFPVLGSARATSADDDPEQHEHRLLVDPARDRALVDDWLRVDTIDDGCAVRPQPGGERDHPMRRRVEETERLFSLNEHVDLRRPRIRARIEVLRALRETGSAEGLRMRAARYHPWSATWRDALRAFAPDVPLPSPSEELRWLLDELLERVNVWVRQMKDGGDGDAWRRRSEEVQWALAFLWADPPTGRRDDVKAWLDENKLTPWVERCFRKLVPTAT